MEQLAFPITVSVESIESWSAVPQGRWGNYNSEVTLKSGQSFLCRETHEEVMEKVQNAQNNDTEGVAVGDS